MLTRGQFGILEKLQLAELLTVSPHLRTPPPPPKLTTLFNNTFFLPDPLLPLLSSSLRSRTSPPVLPSEVSLALRKCLNTSAPGPSRIPYSIWKRVHKANELILPSVFTPLLTDGYQPLAMKKANGIVLDKPGKPDYRTPASFRIIVLLKTVSKILERLSALRLAAAARSLGLIHPNQCGSLAGLGCFDAVATLTHEVRLLQAASFKVSTLFLNVKGGFDNVCANKLPSILAKGGVSTYLVAWIKSCLSSPQCRFIFQGAPKVFCPVAVGTPQGSPISPLLFVLYVASLHPTIPQGLAISYVDDLTITVSSDSVRSNIRALQYYFGIIQRRAADLGVALSVPKTELIHWRSLKDRSDVSFAPIVINHMLFPPSQAVRWLGYWLTPAIQTSIHFRRRLALAQASFTTIQQLSAAGKGLSSWCNRKLVFDAIPPILTYGCDHFIPDAGTLKKLDSFWHGVVRWTTNCFYNTTRGALYREASVPLISSICKHRGRSAALLFVCAPSEFIPSTARIPKSVPTWDQGRSADDHRFLLHGSSKAIHLTSRIRPAVDSAKHLPLDSLCHEVSDLFAQIPIHPLASTDLVSLPLSREPSTTYQALRTPLIQLLLTDWLCTSPPVPLSYRTVPVSPSRLYWPSTVYMWPHSSDAHRCQPPCCSCLQEEQKL